MARTRDDSGQYEPDVSDRDILHHFDASERGFFAASEVAAEFGKDRTTIHRRLSRLADGGELEKVELGSRSVVWRRPRDVIVLLDEDGGFSSIDTSTGVASQGETRAEALRMLADALDSHEGRGEPIEDPESFMLELGVDPDDRADGPPWADE